MKLNATQEQLLEIAVRHSHLPADSILACVDEPHFEQYDKTHDWRNHVVGGIKDEWERLPLSVRLTAYIFASYVAGLEEWE